jgi:hypothetical protein
MFLPLDNGVTMFDDPEIYERTRSLKLGTAKLSGWAEELRSQIAEVFQMSVLNVFSDRIDIGPAKGRPRLHIIVERASAYHFFRNGLFATGDMIVKEHHDRILGMYFDLLHRLAREAELGTKKVLLIIDCFEAGARCAAAESFRTHDAAVVAAEFPTIWKITGAGPFIIAFFIDEKAKSAAAESNTHLQIERACYEGIKRYDEFEYFTRDSFGIRFDSKEILDQKFDGSLFYYFH